MENKTFPNTGSPQFMAGRLATIQHHDLSEKSGIYVNAAACCVPRTHDAGVKNEDVDSIIASKRDCG